MSASTSSQFDTLLALLLAASSEADRLVNDSDGDARERLQDLRVDLDSACGTIHTLDEEAELQEQPTDLAARRARIDALIERYPAHEPDQSADNLGNGRFMLIERSNRGNGHWFSTHDTLGQAAAYPVDQEYAGDWETLVAVDLVDGTVYEPTTVVTWSKAATQ